MRQIIPTLVISAFALAAGCGGNTPDTKADMAMTTADMATVDLAGPPPDMTPFFPVPVGCNTATTPTGTMAYTVITAVGCMGNGCHNLGTAPAFTNQATFMAAMVGKNSTSSFKYVVANDPNRSYLLYKLAGTQGMVPNGSGSQMPQGGTPATPAQMCTIYDWILHGAPTN